MMKCEKVWGRLIKVVPLQIDEENKCIMRCKILLLVSVLFFVNIAFSQEKNDWENQGQCGDFFVYCMLCGLQNSIYNQRFTHFFQ